MSEDIIDIWLVKNNSKRYFKVDVNDYESSIVFYSKEEDIIDFEYLIDNPDKYIGKIFMSYRFRNGKRVDQKNIEEINPKKFREYMGIDFIPYNTPIKFHNSIKKMLDDLVR